MLSAYGVMQDFAETADFRQRQSISCTFQLSPVKILTSLTPVHHGSAVILPVEDFQVMSSQAHNVLEGEEAGPAYQAAGGEAAGRVTAPLLNGSVSTAQLGHVTYGTLQERVMEWAC